MDLYELISRLGLAIGIGLLIGLERGWRRREAEPGSRAAGIRTFAISSLLGGLTAALAQALSKQGLGRPQASPAALSSAWRSPLTASPSPCSVATRTGRLEVCRQRRQSPAC